MNRIIILIVAMAVFMTVSARKYSYSFYKTPVAKALVQVAHDHHDLTLSFIHNELDKYNTSARIDTDDPLSALKAIIGLNPVSIIQKENEFYIEALQHGKFVYSGRVIGSDLQPVSSATVLLLTPQDSTVITFGITDDSGYFTIPCDRKGVIGKLSCIGHVTTYALFDSFNVGTIKMYDLPVSLKTVTVEAQNAILDTDKTTYLPSQRQKNASQTATDLLAHMAIPQLNVSPGSTAISTAWGQPVAIYIDYVPATSNELKMMRISDVKTVEFIQHPTDPRFQGNLNVINFRMRQYEYGGYVKTLGEGTLITNSGSIQSNARFMRKRMTFDVMGYANLDNSNHYGSTTTESFRLPQPNGTTEAFDRTSTTDASKYRNRNYETAFRALYSSDKITANNLVSFGLENTPADDKSGSVTYSSGKISDSQFQSNQHERATNLNYDGYYYFALPHNNSLVTSLQYKYSRTDQSSRYAETGFNPILNAAHDYSHFGQIRVDYSRQISTTQSISAFVRYLYEHNNTRYSGSLSALDRSTTKFGMIGTTYSYHSKIFNGDIGFGWDWLSTTLNNKRAYSNTPYLDISLLYRVNRRNRLNLIFHYSVWPPSSNYKSENLIQVSPLLWYTGNPLLKSYSCYDLGVNYTFIPSNRFRMTAFANTTLRGGDGLAFIYEATPTGIIRTIEQPIGHYRSFSTGINASSPLLEGKLNLSGRIEHRYVDNGQPFNMHRSFVSWQCRAIFYAGQLYFSAAYHSAVATDKYRMETGIWTKTKSNFILQAGWSDSMWNLRLTAQNLQRWNWNSAHETMNSPNYSFNRLIFSPDSHALIQLSATFTFGYGKKIKQGDDISKQVGASSGILK